MIDYHSKVTFNIDDIKLSYKQKFFLKGLFLLKIFKAKKIIGDLKIVVKHLNDWQVDEIVIIQIDQNFKKLLENLILKVSNESDNYMIDTCYSE